MAGVPWEVGRRGRQPGLLFPAPPTPAEQLGFTYGPLRSVFAEDGLGPGPPPSRPGWPAVSRAHTVLLPDTCQGHRTCWSDGHSRGLDWALPGEAEGHWEGCRVDEMMRLWIFLEEQGCLFTSGGRPVNALMDQAPAVSRRALLDRVGAPGAMPTSGPQLAVACRVAWGGSPPGLGLPACTRRAPRLPLLPYRQVVPSGVTRPSRLRIQMDLGSSPASAAYWLCDPGWAAEPLWAPVCCDCA